MLRREILALPPALAALLLTGGVAAARRAGGPLGEVVHGSQRSAQNVVRDPWRHPLETLTFWGLRPEMTVVEIDPSGGYWTEVLAPYLKATGGRYIAVIDGDPRSFAAKYEDQTVWGPIEIVRSGEPLGPAGSADLVITARNIHDWMWTPGTLDHRLADFRAVLRPQGLLGVEEHRADPRPMRDNAHDGYVATAWLVDAVSKAGFRLDGASEINANPKDDKDHPFGVWTLPPTLRSHEKDKPVPTDYDRAKYVAIGESDRMTLRFLRT